MMWLLRSFLPLAVALLTLPAATTANNNYNSYQYDRTVMQFNHDGRLLQVEYASAAADHSTPVVAASVAQDLLLICTTTRRPAGNIYQELLVLVPTGSTIGTTASSEEEYVVVALTGVLADSLALLETVQEERFSQLDSYSASEVARTIADQCQRHTFGGGLRPFGATLLVCGVSNQQISLFRTDPSGAIFETPSSMDSMVVGGGSVARTLKQRLSSLDSSTDVQTRIGNILSLVLQEQQKADGENKDAALVLEAVLVSKHKGVLKLSMEQIESFFQQEQRI
jgi:proteasome alpha subunit